LKTYEGRRKGHVISVTVDSYPLNPRLDLRNHSPTGFEWGYGGSGPAQLAIAILADCIGEQLALLHYQEFKRLVVAAFAHERWTLTEVEIREAISSADKHPTPP